MVMSSMKLTILPSLNHILYVYIALYSCHLEERCLELYYFLRTVLIFLLV